MSIIFDINFGSTSLFNESLKQQKIINSNLEVSSIETDTHVLYTIFLETDDYEKAIQLINKEVKKITITEEQLERKKKTIISSNVFMSDNIFSINRKIMSDIIKYNRVLTNVYSIVKSLNIKDAKSVIKKMNFDNNSVFIINKK